MVEDVRQEEVEFRFSQNTIDQLKMIKGLSQQNIRRFRQVCAMFVAMPDSSPVGDRKIEIQRLLKQLKGLADAMDRLTVDTYIDLLETWKTASGTSGTKYTFDNFIQFRRETGMLTDLATQTLDDYRPKEGRSTARGRLLALWIAYQFQVASLPLSTYESGTYMRVLGVLFAELVPEAKQAGFSRHGKWAMTEIGKLNSK